MTRRRADDGAGLSDEAVLAEFLSGRPDRFALLVERYSGALFQFVSRFVRDPAVNEDVVQETFVQVYQSAASFDPSRRFRPWLFTIAANKARDHLRSQTRRRESPLSSAGPGIDEAGLGFLDFLADDLPEPAEGLAAREDAARVREIVAKMPDLLREVLILAYFNRLAYKEIAEVLSIPLGTVKSRLHGAVSHFAQAYRAMQSEGTAEGAS